MARWAVFDVDGTLLPGTSMEKVFIRYLLINRHLPVKNLIYFSFNGFVRILSYGLEEGLAGNKGYIKGLPVSSVDEWAETCYGKNIKPAISDAGLEKLESLRNSKYKILIISGSPSFLVQRLVYDIRPDHYISSVLGYESAYFTGKVEGIHPFGERKKELLQKLAPELDLDFAQSIVFANHHTDEAHMELFGKAVAVNPTEPLYETAQRRKWEITSWR